MPPKTYRPHNTLSPCGCTYATRRSPDLSAVAFTAGYGFGHPPNQKVRNNLIKMYQTRERPGQASAGNRTVLAETIEPESIQ